MRYCRQQQAVKAAINQDAERITWSIMIRVKLRDAARVSGPFYEDHLRSKLTAGELVLTNPQVSDVRVKQENDATGDETFGAAREIEEGMSAHNHDLLSGDSVVDGPSQCMSVETGGPPTHSDLRDVECVEDLTDIHTKFIIKQELESDSEDEHPTSHNFCQSSPKTEQPFKTEEGRDEDLPNVESVGSLCEAVINKEQDGELFHQNAAAHKISENNYNAMQKLAGSSHRQDKPDETLHQGTICDYSTTIKSHLTSHKRPDSQDRPFECEVCKKSFPNNSALKAHNRIHTGEKPFCCALCGTKFSQLGHLSTHMSRHTGDTPYECQTCGKRFAHKQNLQRHQTTRHDSDPPRFICSFCTFSSKHKNSVNEHEIRHHRKTFPRKCSLCKWECVTPSQLQRHMATKHKE